MKNTNVKSSFEKGSEATKRSFPLLGIVFIILLVMRIMGWGLMATASWWWVAVPLLLPIAIGLSMIAIALAIWLVGVIILGIVYAASESWKAFKK